MSSLETTEPVAETGRVYRIEVHPLDPADDPAGRSVLDDVREQGLCESLAEVRTAAVYLVQGAFDEGEVTRMACELFADPVNQRFEIGASTAPAGAALIEVHHLPGVMDPAALSARDAIDEMFARATGCEVRTARRFELHGATAEQAGVIARRLLANDVVHAVHDHPAWPQQFEAGTPCEQRLVHVPILDLDDAGLASLSRTGHLFLSLEEMQALQGYYRKAEREPTDIELETFAQTWSEHCVHKTLKSRIRYREDPAVAGQVSAGPGIAEFADRSGHRVEDDGTLVIDNLLKHTVAAATNELIENGLDWCLSVFVDNAGVIRFDDEFAVTFKVETHNHPSAIEPYGGAATGIGGCIRDTMGTGLAARPIASTNVFAVASPDMPFDQLPAGVLHPRRILRQVVAGVRDYGNRMGIPTVNGAIWFDDRYLGNPLVFAGSVGLIPNDKVFGDPEPGDRIIALGGRTGRDGIHGATFSSAELTDTHADEFAHAVQIGNAITEKKTLDVILAARDASGGCLYRAITDCGAGGFSSAVGEMGEKIGATVDLERAPLKYRGLSYTEIWISEAQERMVLAVPESNLEQLAALCDAEDVEMCDLGTFGTEDAELILRHEGMEVGRISMDLLHNGIPQPERQARFTPPAVVARPLTGSEPDDIATTLLSLLGHPNIASKHFVVRQYDHEVQGGSVVKPLVGPFGDAPSDAAVIRPRLGSDRGLALSCGLTTLLGEIDPYHMAVSAIDEAVRNAVCVGARPDRIAILDNFCFPSCDDPANLGALVRAAEGCRDGALAFGVPFISGKDSLNNQFTTDDGKVIAIPPTLLISAMGLVDDVNRCVTMDAKAPGNLLIQVGTTGAALGGSHLGLVRAVADGRFDAVDLERAPVQLASVARLIDEGLVRSAHDCSEGGLLVAAAEMAFGGRVGLDLDLAGVPRRDEPSIEALCFGETPSRVLLEIEADHLDRVARLLRAAGVAFGQVGRFVESDRLSVRNGRTLHADLGLEALYEAWHSPLDW